MIVTTSSVWFRDTPPSPQKRKEGKNSKVLGCKLAPLWDSCCPQFITRKKG